MDAAAARAAGRSAADHLIEDGRWRSARSVLLYAAVRGEIDPGALAAAAWADGKRVCLPRPDPAARALQPAPWYEGEALVNGPYGIPMPARAGAAIDVDVVVVPGLAFDRSGGRLGSGLGFYDRWLAAHPDVWRVGFAYVWQVVEHVPVTAHDVPMQALATPDVLWAVAGAP
jgi:5-formyltetrahydrofolate cyclo-ligase